MNRYRRPKRRGPGDSGLLLLGTLIVAASAPSAAAQTRQAADAEPAAASNRPVGFIRDVVPVLTKVGCNGGSCHGSFQGRGGFRLSLFGFDPERDYAALVKEGRGRRVSPSAPAASLALRKPLGRLPHGGGKRFDIDDESFRILRDWIEQGAHEPANDGLHVERIVVTPPELVLKPGEHARIKVEARWSDGVVRDATKWTLFESRDETYAAISRDGRIEAIAPGRTAITAVHMGRVGAVTVTMPYGDVAEAIGFPETNFIDQLVAAEWKKVGLAPARLAEDSEFVRRVYLDVIGTLPTVDEARRFVASNDPDKRARLIDALLERPEYVDYWATKWGDLLRVHRRYVGEKGLWSFWNWVRQAIRENRPVDRMTRELLTSRGSLFTNGATAFYYVDEKPEELAETTAQVFLGVRLQCARCHHHPYEVWSQEDYYGLASFFTRIELKDNKDAGRFGGAKLLRPVARVNRQRRTKVKAPPKVFGHEADPAATDDVRRPLAEWITSPRNPYFARNFVNRYWAYLMGRGLVEPIDDLRATNPPTHPALLDALAKDFIAHGYDLKRLIRTICNSRVYQLASVVSPSRDRDGIFYTHHRFRRLPAAVLLDAVDRATGTTTEFRGLPQGTRAISLPDPAIPSYFLEAFGRSVRSSPCECATSTEPDLAQALHLINSDEIDVKLRSESGRVARLFKSEMSDAEMVDDLYYATVCRPASDEERVKALKFIHGAPSRREGFEDLLWTLINSTEFVFNH